MSGDKIIKNKGKIRDIYARCQEELKTDTPIVVICGPSKTDDDDCEKCNGNKKRDCLYYERLRIREVLSKEDCMPVMFEDDFDLTVASLEETIILHQDEVEKVVVIPSSEGSGAELAQFARDPRINKKLVVLVPCQFHPWYSDSESFLTSVYTEIIGNVGSVYPFDTTREKHPLATEIISEIMHSYRLNKLAGVIPGIIKDEVSRSEKN